MRKPKTVEIRARVRVPKHWSAAHARHEVSQQWYGEIYAYGPRTAENGRFGEEVSLFPRWGKARVVKPEAERPRFAGAAVVALPYSLESDIDDASIIARVGRWLDTQPKEVGHALADFLTKEAARHD